MPKGVRKVGKRGFREITDILNNSADRAMLSNQLDEAVRCKKAIKVSQGEIKNLRDDAVQKLQMQPKLFNQLANLLFNNNFSEKKEELETLEAAIEALMKNPALGEDSE